MKRRELFEAAALGALAMAANAQEPAGETHMADVPLSSGANVTVERRGQIVLIGLNRPEIYNRIHPPMRQLLAQAYFQYEHDASLRCAILFGHGENFSRGIDVDAAQTQMNSGGARPSTNIINPTATTKDRLTKPLIVVAHGDTWNLGHELYLAADIRIAALNTRFGQDEASHARFPGGGGTVRFVREAGWGNAMRYMLTGDHWSEEESRRMGVTQEIAPTPDTALELAVQIANRVAGCGPLGIKATLASAHQVIDPVEAEALSKLGAQYSALYRTEDFLEGRKAEAENRPAKYQGK